MPCGRPVCMNQFPSPGRSPIQTNHVGLKHRMKASKAAANHLPQGVCNGVRAYMSKKLGGNLLAQPPPLRIALS